MPVASFWYHTYGSIEVVAPQRRQQCAWCIRWTMTTTAGRYGMRTYCCPLLAAYKNRTVTVVMVRKTIWTISTHTGEHYCCLNLKSAGWAATCIHATCSCCRKIQLQQRRMWWVTDLRFDKATRQSTARTCHTRTTLPAAAGRDSSAGCSVLFALLLLFWADQSRTAANSREIPGTNRCDGWRISGAFQGNSTQYSADLSHAHGVACCCWARQCCNVVPGSRLVVACSVLCRCCLLLLSLVSGSWSRCKKTKQNRRHDENINLSYWNPGKSPQPLPPEKNFKRTPRERQCSDRA